MRIDRGVLKTRILSVINLMGGEGTSEDVYDFLRGHNKYSIRRVILELIKDGMINLDTYMRFSLTDKGKQFLKSIESKKN